MATRILLSVLIFSGFLAGGQALSLAQSTLEYSTLISSVSAAASKAAAKSAEDESKDVYKGAAQAMTKSASLLGQAGSGTQTPASIAPEAQKTETGPEIIQEAQTSGQKPKLAVKVYLKNGSVIEGNLIEQKEDHIKVDTSGIPVTYFNEEIDKIEEAS